MVKINILDRNEHIKYNYWAIIEMSDQIGFGWFRDKNREPNWNFKCFSREFRYYL